MKRAPALPERAAGPGRPAAVRFGVPDVWIEYPKPGEGLLQGHYAFQVCAVNRAVAVELSVDGGPWLACRESMGLWWLDWRPYPPGPHEARARVLLEGDGFELSEPRAFLVL